MGYKPSVNVSVELKENPEVKVRFGYEVWSNQESGEGIVNIRPQTETDRMGLVGCRTDLVNLIKEEEKLDRIRYFEDQGQGRHMEVRMMGDADGKIVGTLGGPELSTQELHRQGKALVEQEWEQRQNLSSQQFGEQTRQHRRNQGQENDP